MLHSRSVRTVLRKHKGLVRLHFLPLSHLLPEILKGVKDLIPALNIPPIVPVQTDKIAELVAFTDIGPRILDLGEGSWPLLGIQRQGVGKDFFKIRHALVRSGLRLI